MTDKKKQSKTDDELAMLQQQVAELTEALQRERADATNIRRRHDEQVAGLKNLVKANVVRDLLPVIDNFERALKHSPTVILSEAKDPDSSATPQNDENADALKKYEDFVKGVQGVVKQFEKTLTDIGVERIATVGEPFDPRYHEAVSMEEGEGATEVVSEELQAGYKLGDEVIRHAMVRVKMA
jgi:molecular chaperone GrpE